MGQSLNHELPHQSNLRRGRTCEFYRAYYVTKNAIDRSNAHLNTEPAASEIIASFKWTVDQGLAKLGGFVVMDDHYHLIVALCSARELAEIIASIDKHTALAINRMRGHQGKFWQQGYYDHAIRNKQDFLEILHYIHQNPVRKEMAESADLYCFSTAHPLYENLIDWDWFN
jgi:putative transposase